MKFNSLIHNNNNNMIMISFLRHSTDIDECSEKLDNCTSVQICTDHMGSFECRCKEGYHPTENGTTCLG